MIFVWLFCFNKLKSYLRHWIKFIQDRHFKAIYICKGCNLFLNRGHYLSLHYLSGHYLSNYKQTQWLSSFLLTWKIKILKCEIGQLEGFFNLYRSICFSADIRKPQLFGISQIRFQEVKLWPLVGNLDCPLYRVRQQNADAQNFDSKETFKKQV